MKKGSDKEYKKTNINKYKQICENMEPIQIITYIIVYGLIILAALYFASRLYNIFIKKEYGCSSCENCNGCGQMINLENSETINLEKNEKS